MELPPGTAGSVSSAPQDHWQRCLPGHEEFSVCVNKYIYIQYTCNRFRSVAMFVTSAWCLVRLCTAVYTATSRQGFSYSANALMVPY